MDDGGINIFYKHNANTEKNMIFLSIPNGCLAWDQGREEPSINL